MVEFIRNNSSPSIGVLQKTNVIYKFKCPLGDCISDNIYIYMHWFNLNYPVEETDNAPFRHNVGNSSAFKKTFMPNGTATENSHRQHNNIRTSK